MLEHCSFPVDAVETAAWRISRHLADERLSDGPKPETLKPYSLNPNPQLYTSIPNPMPRTQRGSQGLPPEDKDISQEAQIPQSTGAAQERAPEGYSSK